MSHLESCCPLDLDYEWNTLQRVGEYWRLCLEDLQIRERWVDPPSEFPTMIFSYNMLFYENKKHVAISFLFEYMHI